MESRILLNGSQIVLGPSTQLPDQPYVDIEVRDPSVGPLGLDLGPNADPSALFPYNHVLLDTGANSITIVSDAAQALVDKGLQKAGTFSDFGVAGATDFNLSTPYQLDFSGTNGVVHTLRQTTQDVRILTNPDFFFDFAVSDGGIPGVVGMPAMVNRVTTLDTSALANFDPLGVTFSDTLPAGNGHRYTVQTNTSVTFDPRDGLPAGSSADAPVPSWAPVTFVRATVEANGISKTGNFLVDTGAQMSVISPELAFSLGLDTNHDGSLLDEALDTVPIAGVGGTINLPYMAIDMLSLASDQGPNLVWEDTSGTGGLGMLVEDIAPGIDGVLGADFLTAGLSYDDQLNVTSPPYFDKVNLDFRNLATEGTGQIVFDLNSQYDTNVRTWTTAAGGNWNATRNWSGGITPKPGDLLMLQTSSPAAMINDLPSGQIYGGIFTNGSATVSGNPVVLDAAGGTAIQNDAGNSTLDVQTQLASNGTVRILAGQLTFDSGLDTNAHQLSVDVASGAVGSISGAITGAGTLQKLGSGTLTLSGTDNTYSGGTTVAGGKLIVTSSHALPDGTSLTVGTDAAAIFDPAAATATWVSNGTSEWNNISYWVDNHGVPTVPGIAPRPNGTDTAIFNGSGSVTTIDLTGDNLSMAALNFSTANYTLSGGSLILQSGSNKATILVGSGVQVIASPLTLSSNTEINTSGTSKLTLSGSIGQSGHRSLTKTGSGTLTLQGANTYTGGTVVTGGKLIVANAQSLANGSSLSVGSDAGRIFGPSSVTTATAASAAITTVADAVRLSTAANVSQPTHKTGPILLRPQVPKAHRLPMAAELPLSKPSTASRPALSTISPAAADRVLATGVIRLIHLATRFPVAAAVWVETSSDSNPRPVKSDASLLTQMFVRV